MGVSKVETERRLPYPPELLCGLVGDIRRYPEFIPWIQELSISEEKSVGDEWTGIAHVVVGWRNFSETFATKVRNACAAGEVDVSLVKGPLHTLQNTWRFSSDGAGGSIVRFWIAYDFKNPLYNIVLNANRDRAIARIMGAFEAEAQRRFGAAA